jgi:hypothetical protein
MAFLRRGPSENRLTVSLVRTLAACVVGTNLIIATAIGAPIASADELILGASWNGDIHILLVEQAWNSDSGHWGGFSLAVTLTTQFRTPHYEQHPEGPWDLESYKTPGGPSNQPFGSFTLVQTVPAGLSGTCKATYHFQINSVTGAIAGLSESPVTHTWSATLDLGLTALATNIGNSNCGPNLEATTHPFGAHQKITIPIESTATWADRELSFRSTSQSEVAGGPVVVKIDGALKNAVKVVLGPPQKVLPETSVIVNQPSTDSQS